MAVLNLRRRLGRWFGPDRMPGSGAEHSGTQVEGHTHRWLRITVVAVLLVAVLGLCGLAWYWSRKPAPLEESELRVSLRPLESPIVLPGDGFGIVPSHDLSIAAYVSSAVNIIRTLETLMQQD